MFPGAIDGVFRYASLLGLFLVASLPFLIPLHIRPITTFYGEWWAAVLALALLVVAIARQLRSGRFSLPTICLLPTIFLVAIGLQFMGGLIYFPQQGVIYALYLLLAAGAMIAGHLLAQDVGESELARSLAAGFVVGALLQGIPSVLQLQGQTLSGWTTPLAPGYSMYGNLGHQNHLAHVFWLGMASLLWLQWQKHVTTTVCILAGITLLLLSPFTSSRSVYLYPAALFLISLMLWPGLRAIPHGRRIVLLCALLMPTTWVFNQISTTIPVYSSGLKASSADRLIYSLREPGSQSVRLALMRVGLAATETAPWLGNGVGSVPLSSLNHAAAGQFDGAMQVAEHFHNIVVNWLAEFGIPTTILALLVIAAWVLRLLRYPLSPERWWALAMLSVTSVHSLLEYPLWHSYFLVPAALLLGAFSATGPTLRLTTLIRSALLAAGVMAAYSLHTLRDDHLRLARVIHIVPSGPQAQEIWRAHIKDLLVLHKQSMFSPYVNGMLVVAMDVDRTQIENKQQLCDAALHFSPAPSVLFKCAAIRVLAGNTSAGEDLLRRGLFAFPGERAEVAKVLDELNQKFPQLQGLRKIAQTRSQL